MDTLCKGNDILISLDQHFFIYKLVLGDAKNEIKSGDYFVLKLTQANAVLRRLLFS